MNDHRVESSGAGYPEPGKDDLEPVRALAPNDLEIGGERGSWDLSHDGVDLRIGRENPSWVYLRGWQDNHYRSEL